MVPFKNPYSTRYFKRVLPRMDAKFNRKGATDAIKQEKGRQEEGKDIESEMYLEILVSLIPPSNACVLHENHPVPFSFVPYFLF